MTPVSPRASFDAAPVALACLDPQGVFLHANRAFVDLFGLSSPDLTGKSILNVAPALAQQVEQIIRQVVLTGQPIRDAVLADPRYDVYEGVTGIETTWQPIWDGMSVVAVDVVGFPPLAARAQPNDLVLRDARFRALQAIPSALVWSTAPDGTIIDMPEWRAYTGQSKDEVKGWGWLAAVHPDDQERSAQIWQAAVDSRSQYISEYRVRRTDGVYVWQLAQGVPILDESGVLREWVGINIDIDDRKRAAAALEAANEEFTLVANNVPGTVCRLVHCPDGARSFQFVGENIASVAGVTAAEVLADARVFFDLIPPESLTDMFAEMDAAEIRGAVWQHDFPIRHRSRGIEVWLNWQSSCVPGEDGLVVHYGYISDVSAQKELELETQRARDAAEAAAQAKGDFLAKMSHEIRTPMNAIIGMSQLALAGDVPARERGFVEKAHRAAMSLLSIVNDILDVSKLDAGGMTLEKVEFDLEHMLEETALSLAQPAADGELALLFDVDDSVPTRLVGDPLRLRQVLTNLGANAIKFTDSGTVTLAIRTQPPTTAGHARLRFSVSDTGIGMTASQTQRVFEPFAQADDSTTREFGGTGLGLSISQSLVELMGGRIEVESVVGKGSTFHFTVELPVAQEPAGDVDVAASLRGRHVLVATGPGRARDALAAWLRQAGAVVAIADDALDWSAAHVDLVLHDEASGVALPTTLPARCAGSVPRIAIDDITRPRNHTPPADWPSTSYRLTTPLLQRSTLQMAARALSGTAAESSHSEVLFPDLRSYRILLVEDNVFNQELAMEILARRSGADVTLADNGVEALAALESHDFDLVFMDCQMPVMDGYEATRRIRAVPAWAGLPIIAMTANTMSGDPVKAAEAGMNDFVGKPIDLPHLFAVLRRWGPGRRHGHAPQTAQE